MKTMKKAIALILIIAALSALVLSLTSCKGGGAKEKNADDPGRLSGTYDDEIGLISYIFNKDEVTMNLLGTPFNGTYKIEGDEIIMTMLGEDTSYSFERISDTVIKIDGQNYTKK